MNDNEKVISELKSASEWFTEHGRNTNTAIIGICERAIGLINRLQADKEALINGQETLQKYIAEQKAENERLNKECDNLFELMRISKSEARKEFAERLKKESVFLEDDERYVGYAVKIGIIDNLLKELDGKEKENAQG